MSISRVVLAVLLLTLAGGCAQRQAEVTALPTVCHDCFWSHQDPGFREELIRFYEAYATPDPLVQADVALLLAQVRNDPAALCDAVTRFRDLASAEEEPRRALYIAETLAFTARACGRNRSRLYRRAAKAARRAGEGWKAGVYDEVAGHRFRPEFGDAPIGTKLVVPEGCTGFVLGESAIRLDASSRIGVQVERTVRDWLSYQMRYGFGGDAPPWNELLDYHEGARVREILRSSDAELLPLPGTLAARRGERWLAPDQDGVFRFEVLPDKVQYPTTRVDGELALLPDTHGISSLVQRAAAYGATLIVGCGDSSAKAEAAYWLARNGVDVYFPCDRFVGELIGHDAPGTLIGSAPVRAGEGFAVVGDRPVRFRVDETIVVQDTRARGTLRYYDAPARYFRRLSELLPLHLEVVEIDEAGSADRVVRRARETGSKAIALRVWTEEDFLPVRDWLAESPEHRAVLFHSAPYPAGVRLFEEFPGQTTFGDPRPRFLSAAPGSGGGGTTLESGRGM